jgi:hypothetical protein
MNSAKLSFTILDSCFRSARITSTLSIFRNRTRVLKYMSGVVFDGHPVPAAQYSMKAVNASSSTIMVSDK